MARVLLVEDDAAMAQMIRDILESGGYQVACAEDGVAALKFLGMEPSDEVKRRSGEADWKLVANEWTKADVPLELPDAVLSDCMMPRLDGFTMVSLMAQDARVGKIPVVVLTTKAKMEEPFRQLANVAGFIAKPADPDRLLELVGKAVASAPSR